MDIAFRWNLKRLRDAAGMSQEDIADLLGVKKAAVSKYEKGSSYPKVPGLLKLCQRFNVTLDELIFENSSTGNESPAVYKTKIQALTERIADLEKQNTELKEERNKLKDQMIDILKESRK